MCSPHTLLFPDNLRALDTQIGVDCDAEPDRERNQNQDHHKHHTVHQNHVPLGPQEKVRCKGKGQGQYEEERLDRAWEKC